MEQFKQIYRILSILRKAMDLEEWDSKLLSPEALDISLPMWSRLMKKAGEMLQEVIHIVK